MAAILFIIAVFTSVIGAICGIGGGILIKPVLDLFGIMSVSAVSFLSGCTVLAMSIISVGKTIRGGDTKIDKRLTPVLGLGAIVGGLLGKLLFGYIKQAAGNESLVGLLQAVILGLLTLGTIGYILLKNRGKIETRHVKSLTVGGTIGLVLGVLSSFLGIGGGPMNLAVLSFFFSMDTKAAAVNSLCIILLSQLTSLLQTLITGSLPEFDVLYLAVMVAGGVIGGFLGQSASRKLAEKQVERLFLILLMIITGVCAYNALHFAAML